MVVEKQYMKQREAIFDYLRILAAFFVIMIHVSADYIGKQAGPEMLSWNVAVAYDVIARFSVPLFFMVSGRFLLDPDYSLTGEKIVAKIGRLLVALLFWSFIYYMLNHALSGTSLILATSRYDSPFEQLLVGEYHLWFLWVLIGLYLAAPLMRRITEEKKATIWFVFLFAVFQIAVPMIEHIPNIGGVISRIDDTMQMKMVVGYSGFYILGYALYRFQIRKQYRVAIYLAGIVSVFLSCWAIIHNSKMEGHPVLLEMDYLHPLVIMASIAVYLVAITFACKWPELGNNTGITSLSSHSFGIYLTHVIFVTLACTYHLMWWIHPLISIPVNTTLIMIMSCCFTWLIRKVPYIGKLIT